MPNETRAKRGSQECPEEKAGLAHGNAEHLGRAEGRVARALKNSELPKPRKGYVQLLEERGVVFCPAAPENKDCQFDRRTGELECAFRGREPRLECRAHYCPHRVAMESRFQRRLRMYALERSRRAVR